MTHGLMSLLTITSHFSYTLSLTLCYKSLQVTLILKHLYIPFEMRIASDILIPLGILRDERQDFLNELFAFLDRVKPGVASDDRNLLLTSLLFVVLEVFCAHSTVDKTIVPLD